MYEPNITLTQKLQGSLNEIEGIRSLLQTIPIVPSVEERTQHEALVETVYYTARIEGNPLGKRVAEKLGGRQFPQPQVSEDEQVFVNLYKAMSFIRHMAAQTDIPIDQEVIKQIHAYVVRDIPSDGSPGVYKTKPNEIKDQATGQRIFLPPSPSDSEKLMSELSAWLSQTPLAIHPVIAAGIAHLELVAIHPFDNGNGRTARALADLVLYRYGYKLRRLFSWVRQVGIDMGTYHEKLRQVLGSEYGEKTDPTTWLEYFTESVAKSLAQRKPWLLQLRETFTNLYSMGANRDLSKDQVEAMVYASIYGSVTTGVYMNVYKLSRTTVIKRLNELVKAGLMRIEGTGRNVRYVAVLPEKLVGPQPEAEGIQLGLPIVGESTK